MKISLAQLNYTVGDLAGNTEKILAVIELQRDVVDLIVFTELAVTGYYPYDLIDRPGFVDEQDRQLARIAAASAVGRAAVVVGHIRHNPGPGKPYFNGLSVFAGGKAIFTCDKRLLPTYNVFHERRHFEPGSPSRVFDWQRQHIGFLICEDAWNDGGSDYPDNPVADLAAQGAQVLISINASPSNLGKQAQRERLVTAISRRRGTPMIYANQVGATDEIVFDGHSFAADSGGAIAVIAPGFEEAVVTLTLAAGRWSVCESPAGSSEESLMFRQSVLGLRDYVRKCGFTKVVVGSSGGIDSALTLALAVEALGPANVLAVTMPSQYSSEGSVTDSLTLCANLGVKLFEAPIGEEFDLARRRFETDFGEAPVRLTLENMQARIRGRKLMEVSNQTGALVISTGNKSEMSVGYATLYGDMNGGLNLIGDLYKTEVYRLARYINERAGREVIPASILGKAPSAELSPGQKDSDALPDYPQLDAVLRLYIEGDVLPAAQRADCEAIVSRMPQEDVARVKRLVDRAEFKRRQAPPIIRMHARAFGDGRRLPIAQQYSRSP